MKALSIILIILCSPLAFSADEDIFTTDINGNTYICMTPEKAMKLLEIYKDYPNIQLKLKATEDLLKNKEEQIVVLTDLNTNLTQQLTQTKNMNAALQEEINKANAWWKSPWLWSAVGIVIGTAATIGIVYAVKGGSL